MAGVFGGRTAGELAGQVGWGRAWVLFAFAAVFISLFSYWGAYAGHLVALTPTTVRQSWFATLFGFVCLLILMLSLLAVGSLRPT